LIPDSTSIVFDTGPLRHFAIQNWLGVLKFLMNGRRVYIPDSVERELRDGVNHESGIAAALDADWIHVFRSNELAYSRAFSKYHDLLVADGKNIGECGVLAMGEVYGSELVIDDSTPRSMAEDRNIPVTATVPLLCSAIREKTLTTPMVESLADDLLSGSYYLPFKPGGFRAHVLENGLLDYYDLQ
jgi:predicted nucleic acid-binding protein